MVTIRIGTGHGSGFFVGKQGHLLTNAHVVGEASKVQIATSSGLALVAEVIRTHPTRDVALLKAPITLARAPHVALATPPIAAEVFAVGSPILEDLHATTTKGVVGGLRTDRSSGLAFIQADAAVSPGSSGEPLYDARGGIIGMSVGKNSGGGAEGLGLFIPIADALRSLAVSME